VVAEVATSGRGTIVLRLAWAPLVLVGALQCVCCALWGLCAATITVTFFLFFFFFHLHSLPVFNIACSSRPHTSPRRTSLLLAA